MGKNTRAQGRGPAYTWRVMPGIIPQARAELKAAGKVTDWKLRHHYRAVAHGVVVPRDAGTGHDNSGGFGVDIVTRARAQHLVQPEAVIGGWAAAALHGLRPDWADHAPVLIHMGSKHRLSAVTAEAVRTLLRPVVQPLPATMATTCPDPRFPQMRVVTPAFAAAQCLWSILTSRHTWWVDGVPGLTWEQVRAVQFIDAFAQCTLITRDEILAAAKGMVNRRDLAPVLALSDDGAQSPMETTMRLMVRDLLPAPHRWVSQVRVDLERGAHSGWTARTLPDLGVPKLKVAVYYDGAHHDTAQQTDVDFDQFHALRDLEWEALRFNKRHLRCPGDLREQVCNVIGRAMAALEARTS